MTTLGPYEVHPFADDFPLIEGEEFDQLVESVKRSGLRDPIVLNHDKTVLIDGRNRYRACDAASVDMVHTTLPERYTEAMILDFIADKNIKRREMTVGQRAFAGLKYKERYAATIPKGRPTAAEKSPDLDKFPSRGQDSIKLAAEAVGASRTAVAQAAAIERDAPDLAAQVRSGALALDTADKQRKERVKSQPRPEPAPKPSPVLLQLRTHDGKEIEYPKPQSKPTFNETIGDGISWASWSWNPVTGCLHGCNYCYARQIATSERFKAIYPAGFTPLFHEERLTAPANTTIPKKRLDDPSYKRVFVCSMADLYGRWVPIEWIDRVHEQMLSNPQWEYLLLTKFPDRYNEVKLPPTSWVGTSVDEQKRVRIAERAFRRIEDVKVKWLSLEPLNEPLEFSDLSMFDWVVIGAQTETRQPDGTVAAFQPPWQWVINITKQAMDAGCKVHWKPNLRSNPGMVWPDEYPEA